MSRAISVALPTAALLALLARPSLAQSGAAADTIEPASLDTASARESSSHDARIIRVGDREYRYTRPGWSSALRGLPGDFSRGARNAFSGERTNKWLALVGGTAALIATDQPIVDEMQRFGDRIHLSKDHQMVDLVKIPIPFAGKDFPIRGPSTFSSFIYFMGDGWSSILTMSGFLATGAIRGDSRALRTASEVAESFLATGITAQVLKHSFGRETPSERARTGSHAGGRWRPFPSWSAYTDNVPGYDAFPSGHLSTVMSTVTVVALNYPEKTWIRPLGYSAMSLLAFQMMNNGVHWASDYPIAIAFGDLFAHIVVARGRTERRLDARESDAAPARGLQLTHPDVGLFSTPTGTGYGLKYRF